MWVRPSRSCDPCGLGDGPIRPHSGLRRHGAPTRAGSQVVPPGTSQADVARDLEVSRQGVSRRHAAWISGGTTALRSAGRAGRLPRLDRSDLRKVERRLAMGPLADGCPTDWWTLQRVGAVIEVETGVSSSPVTSGGATAGWAGAVSAPPDGRSRVTTRPLPTGWRRTGPGQQDARRRKAWICLEDERGLSLLPSVRTTRAPKGKARTLHHPFDRVRLSMSGPAYGHDLDPVALVWGNRQSSELANL